MRADVLEFSKSDADVLAAEVQRTLAGYLVGMRHTVVDVTRLGYLQLYFVPVVQRPDTSAGRAPEFAR
jgi:hypothetical protein